VISQFWVATTAKRMNIDPQCMQQNCRPLNVLSTRGVQIRLISQGVPPLGCQTRVGEKTSYFRTKLANISETVADT